MKRIDKKMVKRAQSSADVMKFTFSSARKQKAPQDITIESIPTNTPQTDLQKKKDFMKKRAISSNNVAGLQVRKFGS
jgi:hypothetical protein